MNSKPASPRLEGESDAIMRIDRYRLDRQRRRLGEEEYDRRRLVSAQRLAARREATPTIEIPDALPIAEHRDELVRLIKQHQVIVVCGETGSGKSTQLPKLCWEAGFGREAMIGHTQPRRIAARSIANRLAEEMQCPLGQWVGYQVRFSDQTSDQTLIKLMTDGVLLAETQSDRFLDAYDAIIVDEAHERSLNIDFLLGYLRRLQEKRSDLRIIITSATIDAERFAEHFAGPDGPAPVVQVQGRGYPVDIEYLPWETVAKDDPNRSAYDLARHVVAGIDMALQRAPGDTLVFLPTERDIREISHHVAGHLKRIGMTQRIELLPLYARLPVKQQQQIFNPDSGGRHRIVFATNVAESSLTVPGIRYVIDSGTARISRYSPRSKVQRLPIEPISRASADQRAGRCGRVGPGVCIRLYSEEDYQGRAAYTTAEIRRTNLASVVLQTKTLKLGNLKDFPLLDPPRPEAISEGIRTLIELGALNDRHQLTEIGRRLGRMPVDPRVGRILLAAQEYDVLPEVLPIAAALEIQDPRDRPAEKRQAADQAHAEFSDPRSDFLAFLRLWRWYDQARAMYRRNALDRQLRKRFLSPNRMREWADVYRQLRETIASDSSGEPRRKRNAQQGRKLRAMRFVTDDEQFVSDADYDAIHQALLTGLLSGVATRDDDRQYSGAGGTKLVLWPGSGLRDSNPKWIVAAELVETSRLFARTVARIQPQWLERIAAHLLKASHHDPHWSTKGNGAFCYERKTLFGLVVVPRRRVPLPPIDPTTARELLIDEGLVEDRLRTTARSIRFNRTLCEVIAELAAKTRRRDLVIDRYALQHFYQTRIPTDVYDRARLEKRDREMVVPEWASHRPDPDRVLSWLSESLPSDPDTWFMQPRDLVEVSEADISKDAFPDELVVGRSRLPLQYRFEPGSPQDGIGLRIHQSALAQISDDRLGWLVPGLLEAKLIAMIKSLPKRIRRNLVPAAEVAAEVARQLEEDFGKVPFLPAVCEAFTRHADMPVRPDDFRQDKLDDSFRFLITVVNDDGAVVAEGRDIDPLLRTVEGTQQPTSEPVSPIDAPWVMEATDTFSCESIPKEVVQTRGGVAVAQYPGLIDHGDRVSTTLFADSASADTALRQGTLRLFAIAQRKELRRQVRWLPGFEQVKIQLSGVVAAADLEPQLIDLLARIAFIEGRPVIRTRTEFEARCTDRAERIALATQQVAGWLPQLASQYLHVRSTLESLASRPRVSSMLDQVRQQLDGLFINRFLSTTPWQWLQHYPRYLAGISHRIERGQSGGIERDQSHATIISELHDRWWQSLDESERQPEQIASSEIRWMIEELRVSLFAQTLGTSVKVSPQRLQKLLK